MLGAAHSPVGPAGGHLLSPPPPPQLGTRPALCLPRLGSSCPHSWIPAGIPWILLPVEPLCSGQRQPGLTGVADFEAFPVVGVVGGPAQEDAVAAAGDGQRGRVIPTEGQQQRALSRGTWKEGGDREKGKVRAATEPLAGLGVPAGGRGTWSFSLRKGSSQLPVDTSSRAPILLLGMQDPNKHIKTRICSRQELRSPW